MKNGKIQGAKYSYLHSMDCIIYVTLCDNCKEKVGGWSPEEANQKWEDHYCDVKIRSEK